MENTENTNNIRIKITIISYSGPWIHNYLKELKRNTHKQKKHIFPTETFPLTVPY